MLFRSGSPYTPYDVEKSSLVEAWNVQAFSIVIRVIRVLINKSNDGKNNHNDAASCIMMRSIVNSISNFMLHVSTLERYKVLLKMKIKKYAKHKIIT